MIIMDTYGAFHNGHFDVLIMHVLYSNKGLSNIVLSLKAFINISINFNII